MVCCISPRASVHCIGVTIKICVYNIFIFIRHTVPSTYGLFLQHIHLYFIIILYFILFKQLSKIFQKQLKIISFQITLDSHFVIQNFQLILDI